ncbi:hypothetical protein BOX15_Mlig003382g1 [Macrostomum lignano]|uniref:Uncharacterized protein n=1 Tax=Macrostomum lignano TaxID=282301 RepID=A0A267EYX5_9PLAT|nr:hypothetical protein BOX15_Mlig003382g1 [Macrostomum lignano]
MTRKSSGASKVRRGARTAYFVLEIYGKNSSLHGLYHLFQSKDMTRRAFWLIVLLAATTAGVYHTVMSIKRYSAMDTFVQIQDEAVPAEFPDITLCRVKPFSESLLIHYDKVLDRYFDTKWSYFNNWFKEERMQKPNESNIAYKHRLSVIFEKFMKIVWASEDFRDLGMFIDSALLSCSYEGQKCDHRNFSLIRDPDGWYCYSFSPSGDVAVGTEGLKLDLFTDTSFYHPVFEGTIVQFYGRDVKIHGSENMSDWNSLDFFLNTHWRSLNQIAEPIITQSNGFRVILHDSGTHPMMSLDSLEFEAGVSAAVNIGQMFVIRQQRLGVSDCIKKPFEQVRYVTNFDNRGKLEYRSYDKQQDEQVIQKKQEELMSQCGCYSHKYPFESGMETLCYHVPDSVKRTPTKEVMQRINCHDRVVAEVDKDTYQLLRKYSKFEPCRSAKLDFFNNVYEWPKTEDLPSVVNKYVLETLYERTDLLPGDGEHHSILNFSDPDIVRLVGKDKIVSRQTATLQQLFHGAGKFSRSSWRLVNNTRLTSNLLRLNIRLMKTKSKLIQEHPSLLEIAYLFFSANSDLQQDNDSSSQGVTADAKLGSEVESTQI